MLYGKWVVSLQWGGAVVRPSPPLAPSLHQMFVMVNFIYHVKYKDCFYSSFEFISCLGVSDDREGLFDTIQRSKAHSQKRGYQCIKAIVQLLDK